MVSSTSFLASATLSVRTNGVISNARLSVSTVANEERSAPSRGLWSTTGFAAPVTLNGSLFGLTRIFSRLSLWQAVVSLLILSAHFGKTLAGISAPAGC